MIQRGEVIPDELAAEVALIINDHLQQQPPSETPDLGETAPVPEEANLLWHLSGRNPEAFIQYLRNYPNPEMQAILRDPERLQQLIGQLQGQSPAAAVLPESRDNIPKAQLNSSNVYGSRYDPKSQKLHVRFNSGSVYEYDGVPSYVFNAFRHGSAPATTRGHNRWGTWWRGKQPSLGASLNEYIKKAGYAYRRLR